MPILGYTLKSVMADHKVIPFNSYKHENKLDLFRLVPNGQGLMSITKIVNLMFGIFQFHYMHITFNSLYLDNFCSIRDSSKIFGQNRFLNCNNVTQTIYIS